MIIKFKFSVELKKSNKGDTDTVGVGPIFPEGNNFSTTERSFTEEPPELLAGFQRRQDY